jgi:hypothetical protein
MPQKNLALEALRRLLNNEIKLRSRKNIVEARSFRDLLENAILRYQNMAINAAQVINDPVARTGILPPNSRKIASGRSRRNSVSFQNVLNPHGRVWAWRKARSVGATTEGTSRLRPISSLIGLNS